MTGSNSSVASGGIYWVLRRYARRRQWLLDSARVLRAALMLGPVRGALVRYYQRSARNPPLDRSVIPLFPAFEPDRAAERLLTDGYAPGLELPEPTLGEILEFCERGKHRKLHHPDRSCPAVAAVAHDPAILEVAKRYLGAEPILYSTYIDWVNDSGSPEKVAAAIKRSRRFHYDVGDFRSLVVVLYLSDVDERSAPHVVVRGTHRRKSLSQLFSRSVDDAVVYERWGGQVQVITGKRGTGFFADLACYHKRMVALNPRLALKICYVLRRPPAPGR